MLNESYLHHLSVQSNNPLRAKWDEGESMEGKVLCSGKLFIISIIAMKDAANIPMDSFILSSFINFIEE